MAARLDSHSQQLAARLAAVALPDLGMRPNLPLTDPLIRRLLAFPFKGSPLAQTLRLHSGDERSQPALIKAALEIAGVSMASMARRLGVSQQAVYLTVQGLGKSRRIADAVAYACGSTAAELWPQVYRSEAGAA